MKKLLCVTTIVVLCSGCAHFLRAPEPIREANTLQTDSLKDLADDVRVVLERNKLEIKRVMRQGFSVQLKAAEKQLVGSDGRVNLDDYKKVLSATSDQIAENDAFYDDKFTEAIAKLDLQFAVLAHLNEVQAAYTNANGVPPESLQALMDAAISSFKQIQDARAEREANKPPDGGVDWGAIRSLLETRANTWITTIFQPKGTTP